MTSLILAVGVLGYAVAAPLGGEAVKAAPVVYAGQTYQVMEEVEYPPISVERGVLINHGKCTAPRRCAKRVLVEDGWNPGNWHWRCLDRRGGWQICGVQ